MLTYTVTGDKTHGMIIETVRNQDDRMSELKMKEKW